MLEVHPQTFIGDSIADNGCLAMCYIYCMGIEPSKYGFNRIVLDAMEKGPNIAGIEDDCYICDAELYLQWLTGKRYAVTKKDTCTIAGITGPYPVRFTKGFNHHWVVVENGEIVFNPLEHSVCVDQGQPDSVRVITLK